jgi:6-phosphogluconate dehydrogenase
MYLDKPMRDHVLLQAIARVNRPYEDDKGKKKPSGFVLDFVGIFDNLEKALHLSKITCYAQGMSMLRTASDEYGFNLKYREIAQIWKGGCIIRARLLESIRQAFARNPELTNLLMDEEFSAIANENEQSLREIVQLANAAGVPAIAFASSMAYYDSYRKERLPANLLQAQRDYFGAHTYRRTDKEGIYHTQWI